MIVTENILPLKTMEGKDWDAIDSGFIIAGSADWLIPNANSFSGQILEYLLNVQLHISNYTKYNEFYFDVTARVNKLPFYHPESISVMEDDEKSLCLTVYMPDAKRFSEVDKHEALRMIAQLFLDSIPKFLFNRDDFDGQKFYDDVLPIVKPIADGTRTFQDDEFPL